MRWGTSCSIEYFTTCGAQECINHARTTPLKATPWKHSRIPHCPSEGCEDGIEAGIANPAHRHPLLLGLCDRAQSEPVVCVRWSNQNRRIRLGNDSLLPRN